MSINIPEGKYQGIATDFEFADFGKGPQVKVTMKVGEGPYATQTAQFKNGFGEKAVKYTRAALISLGWAGQDIGTAKADIANAKKSVSFDVVIASFEGREWSSVRSIGFAGQPGKAVDPNTLKDVNRWLADAGGDDLPF